MKCEVCSLKFTGRIFPPLSWIKLKRRDSRVTETASGRHSSTLIPEMGFSSAELTARPVALNLQGRQALWETGAAQGLELCFPLAAALLQSTGILERRITTCISKEARCRHCSHTQDGGRDDLGGAWAELLPDLAGSKAGIGHPGSVLPSASALPQYKGCRRDKMEVVSPKGSYKDERTKQSVSFSENCAKHYLNRRHQLQNSSWSEITPKIFRLALRCGGRIFKEAKVFLA